MVRKMSRHVTLENHDVFLRFQSDNPGYRVDIIERSDLQSFEIVMRKGAVGNAQTIYFNEFENLLFANKMLELRLYEQKNNIDEFIETICEVQ